MMHLESLLCIQNNKKLLCIQRMHIIAAGFQLANFQFHLAPIYFSTIIHFHTTWFQYKLIAIKYLVSSGTSWITEHILLLFP